MGDFKRTSDGWRYFLDAYEEPDYKSRACSDCKHLVGYVSLWCSNDEAIAWRGNAIPGVKDCPFWEPAPEAPAKDFITGYWQAFKAWCFG